MFRAILSVLILTLVFVGNVSAEQKQKVGNYDIHYVALSSTFLTPSIAKSYGIKRSSYIGIVNISVLDTSQEGNPPVSVEISGIANNLLDARIDLKFREIREGKAIYYIAEVPFRDDQEINFLVAIKYGKKLHTQLKFKQKFYVE
ncbi:DUF4426 domain-containing protein [Shewanella violacea]|uniref:DUF4426 domain-containing protein n=1 Tax=Shewanella violacea (strain JCM 10179 / CIP 106290 / LMG 19151 / DSS12) TaxID=637905 RepID=D4ZH61_SHEVD|nr:DUF4426 domain-containing protein [Shewanella violacea]BAJ01010.1 conserved hypothetical protein [Shewanella violacea DSS12]